MRNNDTPAAKGGARIPAAALTGSLRDYRAPEGKHLLERVNGFFEWQDLRRQYNLWPYAKSTATATLMCFANGLGYRSYAPLR